MKSAEGDGRFLWHTTSEGTYLKPRTFSAQPHIRCLFTTRHAGDSGQNFNLSFDRGNASDVYANRQRVLRALGLEHTSLWTVRQVHGNQVYVIEAEAMQRGLDGIEADALVTDLPEVPLGVLVADCLPIVLYAVTPPVIAAVHAGRMGTYHRITHEVLNVMHQRFAVTPNQVYAVLGPAIGDCCYTLDARAVTPFQRHFPDWEHFFTPCGEGLWAMSLIKANESQLRAGGVPADHIQTADICTACHPQSLFSHRAEGQAAGRGMGVAVLLPTAGESP